MEIIQDSAELQPPQNLITTWIDDKTVLLTYQHVQGLIISLPPNFPIQPPILAISPTLIQYLHCPLDLLYSENKEKLLAQADACAHIHSKGFQPVELEHIFGSQWQDSNTIEDVIERISSFLQKFAVSPPTMAYRFPRLTGCFTAFKLLLLLLLFKFFFFGLIQREYKEGIPFDYMQDFQFHRRWQQTTANLPFIEWYRDNSLSPPGYFCLDYPPIAGYFHSLLGTYITKPLIPQSLILSTLDRSKGTPCEDLPGIRIDHSAKEESIDEDGTRVFPLQASHFFKSHKYFLLARVQFVILDLLFMGFATYVLVQYQWRQMNPRLRCVVFLSINTIPMAVFFDQNDTQINFLSMSLFLLSFRFLISQNYILSASIGIMAFVSKQTCISLFVPFAVLVLSKFWKRWTQSQSQQRARILLDLGMIVLAALVTFALAFLPYLTIERFDYVMKRIFPFQRGIYFTPLPTFWFFVNKIIPILYVNIHSPFGSFLPPLCSLLYLGLSVPGLINLAKSPSQTNLVLAMQQCAFFFFLFGYGNHEKVIMWYILALFLSIFEFPTTPISLLNQVSILLIIPMAVQYGKEIATTELFLLGIVTHYVMKGLPHPPISSTSPLSYPKGYEKLLHEALKLPGQIGKVLPYFWAYVGINQVIYFVKPGQINIYMMIVAYYFIFFMEVSLIIYHYALTFQSPRTLPQSLTWYHKKET